MLNKIIKTEWTTNFVINKIIAHSKRTNKLIQQLGTQSVRRALNTEEKKYLKLSRNFYRLQQMENISGISTNSMKTIYESRFAKKVSNNSDLRREYLRQFRGISCPICGALHAETIDHVLPQSLYPQYTLSPVNMIPMCLSCNHAKLNTDSTCHDDAAFHPYFDDYSNFKDLHFNYDVDSSTLVEIDIKKITDKRLIHFMALYPTLRQSLITRAIQTISRLMLEIYKMNNKRISSAQIIDVLHSYFKKELPPEVCIIYADAELQIDYILQNQEGFIQFASGKSF